MALLQLGRPRLVVQNDKRPYWNTYTQKKNNFITLNSVKIRWYQDQRPD
jgi:hypothetical protein